MQERSDDLLLDHFWLLTSIGTTAAPAEDLLAHYRQRGTAEGHLGELMDVLAPALSSTPRTKRHYRGSPLPALPTGIDTAARNEAVLLLHLLAYELMHAGRRMMEIATRTGWSLRRFRERVLRVGGRVLILAALRALCLARHLTPHRSRSPAAAPTATVGRSRVAEACPIITARDPSASTSTPDRPRSGRFRAHHRLGRPTAGSP